MKKDEPNGTNTMQTGTNSHETIQPKNVSFPTSHLTRENRTDWMTWNSHESGPIPNTLLLGGSRRGRASAGSGIGGAPAAAVIVLAPVVVGVVVRAIAVRVVIAAPAAGVGTPGGVVVIALAVGSGGRHGRWR